jgi:hypothetical protein
MPFELIAEQLLKGGVAPRHVRRYICELDDHFAQLTEQLQRGGCDIDEAKLQARTRLGEDTELVSAMLELPGIRAWSARVPWLVFAAIPPAMTLIMFVIPLVLVQLISPLGGFGGSLLIWLPVSYAHFARYFVDASNLIIEPTVSALFAVMAFRQRLDPRWAVLAAFSIIFFEPQTSTYFSEQTTVGHLGQSASLWIDDIRELARAWRLSAIQAVLTLLPAILLLRWGRPDRTRLLPPVRNLPAG